MLDRALMLGQAGVQDAQLQVDVCGRGTPVKRLTVRRDCFARFAFPLQIFCESKRSKRLLARFPVSGKERFEWISQHDSLRAARDAIRATSS